MNAKTTYDSESTITARKDGYKSLTDDATS